MPDSTADAIEPDHAATVEDAAHSSTPIEATSPKAASQDGLESKEPIDVNPESEEGTKRKSAVSNEESPSSNSSEPVSVSLTHPADEDAVALTSDHSRPLNGNVDSDELNEISGNSPTPKPIETVLTNEAANTLGLEHELDPIVETSTTADAEPESFPVNNDTLAEPVAIETTQAALHVGLPATPSVSGTISSQNCLIFKKNLDTIIAHKEMKKNEAMKSSVQKALNSLTDTNQPKDVDAIFDALQMVCEKALSSDLKSIAVDLFAKLFDLMLFESEADKVELTDRSVDIIAACFEGEGTNPELETQVVRALMHCVLLMPCHGSSLLKAVRQIYNVFIFSLSPRNQAVSQGTLSQIISAIFLRISESPSFKNGSKVKQNAHGMRDSPMANDDSSSSLPVSDPLTEKLTLKKMERIKDDTFDGERADDISFMSEQDGDVAVKDAFLIFRAMCKLLVKPLETESIDMRSHSVRSKLLSLHIIHTILKEHIEVFLSRDVVITSNETNEPTRLINMVRQYINLTISRNAVSPLAPVFELTMEIFWLLISNLRSDFKREIPVFWDEIYFPVAELKTSTAHQKRYLLSVIERLCNDSRCIIEFYLNYDCDSAMPNICEKTINYLTRLSLVRVEVTPAQRQAYFENRKRGISVYDIGRASNLVSTYMSSKPPESEVYTLFPLDYALKITSLSCTVAFLRSLHAWAHKGIDSERKLSTALASSRSFTISESNQLQVSMDEDSRSGSFVGQIGDLASPEPSFNHDDPLQFETLKQRKKDLLEGIRQFNQKAKKGISFFVEHGFIATPEPKNIASFLLSTDGLDKAVIGEYLGEGDEKNIAIMHAFVDQMEFVNIKFVDAMRKFLQSFRLPGEAQKIDRFMLKFAERYLMGNPSVFSNADAAYVLAYSVILLNTDLHSPQIKNRMTLDNFVANNAGIDDGKNLPRELLSEIYDEILGNEIKLQSEQHAALMAGLHTPTVSSGFFDNRDLNREAYNTASREMSTKTEKLMRSLGKRYRADVQGGGVFYAASSVSHVRSIFDTLWMSIMAGLTPPFKEDDEPEIEKLCLEGIHLSIRIACMFDIDYARTSFLRALIQFANLNNFEEMKPKNVEAILVLLKIAVSEGDRLSTSWGRVLTALSQLERLQLIAQGIDLDFIPDVSVARRVSALSIESSRESTSGFFSLFTTQPTASQAASTKFHNQRLSPEVAQLLTGANLEVAIDKVFSNSSKLSGENIVQFVKALLAVALEEVESSGQSANPRTFALQKLVDVCYYNMSRIRLEWSQLWAAMGETFNKVGCHSNPVISIFALDSLRQLSMRFLEIDELSHFKFQKEFLKPFEYVLIHNDSLDIKDMVLECINNMILARADRIKSGWKTIFGALTAAANAKKESLVLRAFRMANWINNEYIAEVHAQECFTDLVICFTQLAKNEKFQRPSLFSLDVLFNLIKRLAELNFEESAPEGSTQALRSRSLSINGADDQSTEKSDMLVKLWFPLLFALHDIIMTALELEVRARALKYLFKVLFDYGKYFELDFWNLICDQLLFPIFGVLNTPWDLNVGSDMDNMSVWLSTTLIQAIKSMIALFKHYFDSLSNMLEGYLALITSCICQEDDAIARIGRECLYNLLVDNASRFNEEQWKQIEEFLTQLFRLTTAHELYTSDPKRAHEGGEDIGEAEMTDEGLDPKDAIVRDAQTRLSKSRDKSTIIVKSVLQLLLIQTLLEMFESDEFYELASYTSLTKMALLLKASYRFAKDFNDDYDLRVRLWNAAVTEKLPNLLKQESSAAAVYINIMFRMYCDNDKTGVAEKQDILYQAIATCQEVLDNYLTFEEKTQQRNIVTWRPVVIEIYQGYVELDDEDFHKYAPRMYEFTMGLFSKSMLAELRDAICIFLRRIGHEFIKV